MFQNSRNVKILNFFSNFLALLSPRRGCKLRKKEFQWYKNSRLDKSQFLKSHKIMHKASPPILDSFDLHLAPKINARALVFIVDQEASSCVLLYLHCDRKTALKFWFLTLFPELGGTKKFYTPKWDLKLARWLKYFF